MAQVLQNIKADGTHISYYGLRQLIGWLGIALPIILLLFSSPLQPSISDYYYTPFGVLFTSILVLLGVFLVTYKGYTEKIWLNDNSLTRVGGFGIMLVAFVPTPFTGHLCHCPTPICHQDTFAQIVHFASAVIFFSAMSIMSARQFVKGPGKKIDYSKDKKGRNIIYKFCGWGMFAVLLFAGLVIVLSKFKIIDEPKNFIFWIEAILIGLFGTSWLTKGKADIAAKEQGIVLINQIKNMGRSQTESNPITNEDSIVDGDELKEK